MESKLQAFQFSVLHRFVPHNSRLFKMRLTDSECCNLCSFKDTILHRFWECSYVSVFWAYYQDWYNKYNSQDMIALSAKDVLFGFFKEQSKYTKNCCLLLAKYYIHKELCKKKNIFHRLLKFLEK